MGPRRSATTMTALCVITASLGLISLKFQSLWVILAIMLPFNFSCSTIWPAIESGVTRSPGSMPLSTRIAIFNLSWGSAGFAAIFTRGILEEISFAAIFIAPAIACAGASIILHFFAVPAGMIGAHNVPDDPKGEHELDDPAVRRRAEMLLKMAWIGNALSYTAIYVLLPVMTQIAERAGAPSLAWAGIIGSVWYGTRFLSFAIAGTWTGWHYKIFWQIGPLLGLTLSLAGMLMIHLVPSPLAMPVLIALQIVFGFSAAMLYSASLYYAMHVSSGHGGHAAFHEAVIGAGTMAGPLIGALASSSKLDDGAMARITMSVSGFLLLGLGAMIWLALSKPRPHAVQSEPNESG